MVTDHWTVGVLVLFAALVVTAGCTETNPGWSLSVHGSTTTEADSVLFEGEVALGGHFTGVRVRGVTVTFLDDENQTLATTTIGELNDSRSTVALVEQFSEPPQLVVPSVTAVEGSGGRPFSIEGLNRSEGGRYYPFVETRSERDGSSRRDRHPGPVRYTTGSPP